MDIKVGTHIFTNDDMLELNEMNVYALYNQCLASNNCEEDVIRLSFSPDAKMPVMSFKRSTVESNCRKIEYMLGQIFNFNHNANSGIITLGDGAHKYDNSYWTKNTSMLAALYYLACANGLIEPFSASSEENRYISKALTGFVLATLSPNDPNYDAWCKQHKAQ